MVVFKFSVFKKLPGDLPGGPVVMTLHSQCRGMDLTPGQGTKISHAAQCSQGKKKLPKCSQEWLDHYRFLPAINQGSSFSGVHFNL